MSICQSFLDMTLKSWKYLRLKILYDDFRFLRFMLTFLAHCIPAMTVFYRLSNAFLSDVSQGGKHRHLAELELSSLWLLIVTWTFRSPRKWAPDVSKWESVWTWAAPVERKERLMSFFFFSKGWPWKGGGVGGEGELFRGRWDSRVGEGFAFLSSFNTLPPFP